ncbi:hypothetical protein TeGR_g12771, partial [Tetraparma gracilis]
MKDAKVSPGDDSAGDTQDFANLKDLEDFEDERGNVIEQKEEEIVPAAVAPAAAKAKQTPAMKAATKASRFRKLIRMILLIFYFCMCVIGMKVLKELSSLDLGGELDISSPVRISVRDCGVTFKRSPDSAFTVQVTMASSPSSLHEVAGNNITVLDAPNSPTECEVALMVPDDELLPSIHIEGWRNIFTVNDIPCEFPFTVSGDATNLTFYDCTYRKSTEEGGVGNGTLEGTGYDPKSPWCSLTPSLTIDEIEDEDAEEILDFCSSQDQLPLIPVKNDEDVDLIFAAYESLQVVGSALYVNLTSVNAYNVDITLSEGMIQLEDLTIEGDSSLSTGDGDITIVTSAVPAILLNYTVGLSDYCVSGRNMTVLSSTNATEAAAAAVAVEEIEVGGRRYRRLEDEEEEEESVDPFDNSTSTEEEEDYDPFAPAYESSGSIKVCYDDYECYYG